MALFIPHSLAALARRRDGLEGEDSNTGRSKHDVARPAAVPNVLWVMFSAPGTWLGLTRGTWPSADRMDEAELCSAVQIAWLWANFVGLAGFSVFVGWVISRSRDD